MHYAMGLCAFRDLREIVDMEERENISMTFPFQRALKQNDAAEIGRAELPHLR